MQIGILNKLRGPEHRRALLLIQNMLKNINAKTDKNPLLPKHVGGSIISLNFYTRDTRMTPKLNGKWGKTSMAFNGAGAI